MKADVKEAWIKALESGDYTQCKGQLRKMNGEASYCCLGVLCDIQEDLSWGEGNTMDYLSGVLTRELLSRFGLDDIEQDHLTQMNDSRRATFPEIASWIKENL